MSLLMILSAQSDPANFIQGGIAGAAILFAGAVVKFMGNLNDKERARGDRLETALVDKAVPAITAAGISIQQQTEAMKELQRRYDELLRNRGDK